MLCTTSDVTGVLFEYKYLKNKKRYGKTVNQLDFIISNGAMPRIMKILFIGTLMSTSANDMNKLKYNFLFHIDGTLKQELEDNGVELTETELNFIPLVKPSHFLLFATGATSIPTIGFDHPPNISFVHDENKMIPSSQTCSNMLYLYVNKHTKEKSIAHHLLTALINGGIFSKL